MFKECSLVCSEREAHRADARGRESESETQLRDMHNLSNQLHNRNQPIQEYLAQNKAEALQRLTADLDACRKRQDKLEAEVQVRISSSSGALRRFLLHNLDESRSGPFACSLTYCRVYYGTMEAPEPCDVSHFLLQLV